MELKKGFKRWAPSAALAATLLASTSAFAGTITIDGITVPVGISLPGGIGIVTQNVSELLITAAGQQLSGVAAVTTILPSGSLTPTWIQSQNGKYLYVAFSGFTAKTVVAPTASTNGTITFTGGTVGLYVFNSPQSVTTQGSPAADVAKVETGTAFLTLSPEVVADTNETLVVTVPAGQSLTAFDEATGALLLDVTGGAAASTFNTNTFFNSLEDTFADVKFTQTSDAASNCSNDFGAAGGAGCLYVQGVGQAEVNTIPAPASLGLMGIGLLGFGLLRRSQSRAKA